MADIGSLIDKMLSDGEFARLTLNPLAQFGAGSIRYVGADILPERLVDENEFVETNMKFRSIAAKAQDRYSTIAKDEGLRNIQEMKVRTSFAARGSVLDSKTFDAIRKMLGRGTDLEATEKLLGWANTELVVPLIEATEEQRWQALVNAEVVFVGENGQSQTVALPDPAGHRVSAGGNWSDDAYDPFDDILAMANLLRAKGYIVTRIITGGDVISLMAANENVSKRTGALQVNASGAITTLSGFATRNAINTVMTDSGLPILETYDLTRFVRTNGVATPEYFLPRDAMVFVCQTGRDVVTEWNSMSRVSADTLGHVAVGLPPGAGTPGRSLVIDYVLKSPVHVEGEAAQETFPVIVEPEAIGVIKDIS